LGYGKNGDNPSEAI